MQEDIFRNLINIYICVRPQTSHLSPTSIIDHLVEVSLIIRNSFYFTQAFIVLILPNKLFTFIIEKHKISVILH